MVVADDDSEFGTRNSWRRSFVTAGGKYAADRRRSHTHIRYSWVAQFRLTYRPRVTVGGNATPSLTPDIERHDTHHVTIHLPSNQPDTTSVSPHAPSVSPSPHARTRRNDRLIWGASLSWSWLMAMVVADDDSELGTRNSWRRSLVTAECKYATDRRRSHTHIRYSRVA